MLHVEADGSGSAILLISGLGGTGAFWHPIVADLTRTRRVVRLDQRGIGRSSRGASPCSIDRLAADCLSVLDHLGIERTVVVGHSTGGAIAQTMALDAPDRVSAIVLGGSWVKADRYLQTLFRSRRTVLSAAPREFATNAVFLSYPPEWLNDHWHILEAALSNAPVSNGSQAIIAERIDALLAFDRTSDLHRLSHPALVLGAEDDIIVPSFHQRRLAAALPQARLEILSRGGHFFPQTRKEAYVERVSAWLKAVGC